MLAPRSPRCHAFDQSTWTQWDWRPVAGVLPHPVPVRSWAHHRERVRSSITYIESNEDYRQQALDEALRYLNGFRRRYQNLQELS